MAAADHDGGDDSDGDGGVPLDVAALYDQHTDFE
jgi:hypothetical protein